MSSAPTAAFRPTRAVPAFPGAQTTSSTSGLWLSFQARVCSRPPPPTMMTFIG